MFSEFMHTFRQFAPRLWSDADGMVARNVDLTDKSAANSKRSRGGRAQMKHALSMVAIMAAAAAVNIPAVAGAHSAEVWEYGAQTQTVTLLDEDAVPANFWPAAISRLRSMRPISEGSADDIEPLF